MFVDNHYAQCHVVSYLETFSFEMARWAEHLIKLKTFLLEISF